MALTDATRLANFSSGVGTDGTLDTNNLNISGVATAATLKVGSAVTVSGGIVTATQFVGDGSQLTGVASTDNIITSGIVTITNATDSTSSTTGALKVTGGIGVGLSMTVGGNLSVGGTLTYEDVTNIDSIGIITAKSGVEFGASGVGGTITATGQAEFAGVVTATSFVGSGANLTGVISGVELEFGGNSVGTAVTNINFVGFSSVTAPNAGLSTVNAPSVAKSSAIANFIGG